MSGRPPWKVYIKLGPEDELFLKKGGSQVQAVEPAGTEAWRQGRGKESSPEGQARGQQHLAHGSSHYKG